jgi:hypothetical protein
LTGRRATSEAAGLSVRKRAAIALVFLVAAGLRFAWSTDEYFTSDIADYARAAQVGAGNLFTESRSVTLVELYGKWKDPTFRKHPTDALYRVGDNLALRHFHGPASFYLLALSEDAGLSERQQRLVWGVIGALTCALLAACLCLMGVGTAAAAGAGLLAAVDYRNIRTDVDPSPPHTLFLMLAMLLFTLAALLRQSNRRWPLYGGAAVLAAATLTFELAPVLVLALAAGMVTEAWNGMTIRQMARPALRFGLVYLGSLAILWPGGLLRGTLPLCLLGNFGILLRWHMPTASPSVFPTLMTLFGPVWATAALLALFLAGLFSVVRRVSRKEEQPDSLVVAAGCYAGLALLFGLASHFKNLPYGPEVFFPALLFMVLTMHAAFGGRGGWAAAAAAVLFAGACAGLVHTWNAPRPRDPADRIVSDVKRVAPSGSGVVLVNDLNVYDSLCLYLPGYHFELTSSAASLDLRHEEEAPHVRLGVFNAALLDGPTRERARLLFPPRFVYRTDGVDLWVGERDLPGAHLP